ncbi:hypothetical protein FNF27_07094 [Cafeteria roenbergensis]|uniref:Uncharacterized protein n=2 Tax=Cafeteria roenbergensis TaxID=33653 RepID=A0A5A8DTD3_CAFRO|nr:hypothetical protein FNF27_07094 [Cafeteria roenbergensis]
MAIQDPMLLWPPGSDHPRAGLIAVCLALAVCAAFVGCILVPLCLAVGSVPEQLEGGIGVLDESGRLSTFAGQLRRRSSFAMNFLETHPAFTSGYQGDAATNAT